jgi:hypothetical protein
MTLTRTEGIELELEAERHAHRKDNEYLLAQLDSLRKAIEGEIERLRTRAVHRRKTEIHTLEGNDIGNPYADDDDAMADRLQALLKPGSEQ